MFFLARFWALWVLCFSTLRHNSRFDGENQNGGEQSLCVCWGFAQWGDHDVKLTPNHKTPVFISWQTVVLSNVFQQAERFLQQNGETYGRNLAIDGVKLPKHEPARLCSRFSVVLPNTCNRVNDWAQRCAVVYQETDAYVTADHYPLSSHPLVCEWEEWDPSTLLWVSVGLGERWGSPGSVCHLSASSRMWPVIKSWHFRRRFKEAPAALTPTQTFIPAQRLHPVWEISNITPYKYARINFIIYLDYI